MPLTIIKRINKKISIRGMPTNLKFRIRKVFEIDDKILKIFFGLKVDVIPAFIFVLSGIKTIDNFLIFNNFIKIIGKKAWLLVEKSMLSKSLFL